AQPLTMPGAFPRLVDRKQAQAGDPGDERDQEPNPGRHVSSLSPLRGQLARVTTSVSAAGSSETSTRTVSPSRMSPDSRALANGSPIADCTKRRNGRAP